MQIGKDPAGFLSDCKMLVHLLRRFADNYGTPTSPTAHEVLSLADTLAAFAQTVERAMEAR